MFTVTFYSFKGGVGRTMALMNVAFDLIKKGKNVTLLDFDLEAPGLKSFKELNKCKARGLQDYVLDYYNSKGKEVPKIDEFIFEANVHKKNKEYGNLYLMPASEHNTFKEIKWDDLYNKLNGYILLEEMKLSIKSYTNCDYLLIDSRTGYTDHSSICTKQLPDLIAGIFFPNKQNIDGMADVIEKATLLAEENEQILPVLFAASRLPVGDDESGSLKSKLDYAEQKLLKAHPSVYPNLLTLHHNSKTELLDQLILVDYKSKGEIQLKNEYEELSNRIEFHNKNSEWGNILFLDFLIEKIKIKNKSPGIFNNVSLIEPISLYLDEAEKNRVDYMSTVFWSNSFINNYSIYLFNSLNDKNFSLRIFWHAQLNLRLYYLEFKNNKFNLKALDYDNDLYSKFYELISQFSKIEIESIDKSDILRDKNDFFIKKSFDKFSIPSNLSKEINQKLDGELSFKEFMSKAAKFVLFEKGKVSFPEIDKAKVFANALFILLSTKHLDFVDKFSHRFVKSVENKGVKYSYVVRNFYRRVNNNFYQTKDAFSIYPFEVLNALDTMDKAYVGYLKILKDLILVPDKTVLKSDKRLLLRITSSSPLLLFEKTFVSVFLLKENEVYTSYAKRNIELFFETFQKSLELSLKYFKDPKIRAASVLKALIIKKLCELLFISLKDISPDLNFNIQIDTLLGYDGYELSLPEDDIFYENIIIPGTDDTQTIIRTEVSYYEYLDICIEELYASDLKSRSIINPLTHKKMNVTDLELFSSTLNSLKNINEFNFLE